MTLDEQIRALNLQPMTDEEHARFCGLSMAQWEKYKPKLTDQERAIHEQMRGVELLCALWQSEIEPYPSDVRVNRGRSKKRSPRPPPGPNPIR